MPRLRCPEYRLTMVRNYKPMRRMAMYKPRVSMKRRMVMKVRVNRVEKERREKKQEKKRKAKTPIGNKVQVWQGRKDHTNKSLKKKDLKKNGKNKVVSVAKSEANRNKAGYTKVGA